MRVPEESGQSFAARLGERRALHRQRATVYRILFAAAGLAVLLTGVAMLVLPGPGLLVTGAGLAMLAREFAWAAHLLSRLVARIDAVRARATRRST